MFAVVIIDKGAGQHKGRDHQDIEPSLVKTLAFAELQFCVSSNGVSHGIDGASVMGLKLLCCYKKYA
jgi:hypothetical protein